MEAPWRWTSSVFLVLALYIGNTWTQNVGPHCLTPETFQGELLPGFNSGLINSQPQMNNMFLYPPNRVAPEGPAPVLESQRQVFQDRLCTQCPPNQQACQCNERTNTVPILQSPCTNVGPAKAHSLSANPGPLFINTGSTMPFTQLKMPQGHCLNEPPTIQNLPQQNVGLSQSEILPPQGPLLPFVSPSSTLTGTSSSLTLSPNPGNYLRIESVYPNNFLYPNNGFTPSEPAVHGLFTPSKDVLSSPGAISPSLLQGLSPMYSRFTSLPLNNEETTIDVISLGPTQCPTFNEPLTNPYVSLPNKMPLKGPIDSQLNNLPQVPTFGPWYDFLPETPGCPAASTFPSTFQNQLPPTPLNMFRFPRTTMFQGMPFQGPLPSSLTVACDINTNIAIQDANPALIQQDPINFQVSTAPATFIPNLLPGLTNQNFELYPLQSFPVPQPLLNSGSCSLTPDISPVNFLPSPIIPQSCALPPNSNGFGPVLPHVLNFVDYPITPLNLSPPCLEATTINEPRISDASSLCEPVISNTLPVPIHFQINVPPPIISPPRITIINAAPAPDSTVLPSTEELFDFPYPMPPIIIEGSRSRSRSWLPLILVALFADDFGGYGDGCSCDSSPIPIPYPIAIPTNNPVIVNN